MKKDFLGFLLQEFAITQDYWDDLISLKSCAISSLRRMQSGQIVLGLIGQPLVLALTEE